MEEVEDIMYRFYLKETQMMYIWFSGSWILAFHDCYLYLYFSVVIVAILIATYLDFTNTWFNCWH
jgi:hypothetical protein